MKEVVLITGASSGIGKATALQLINNGYIVYACARRTDKMKELSDIGGHVIKLDVTDPVSVRNAVSQIVKEQGRIDVLFNNAGYGSIGAVEDVDLADARRQFEVNVFGVADLTKEVLPVMRKQQSGKIIMTSSMGGKTYAPLASWYHASKHALEGWSDCLRLEVKPFGIDVVIIEPGMIATGFGDITLEPLQKLPVAGPYQKMYQSLLSAVESSNKKGSASPAAIIADIVSGVIRKRKPKIRYVAGTFAKPALFIRKWFGDKIFDKVVMSQFK
jgi:NAD(P)-dependent dehydrogenase (short-subunit alcohol dehydrogenase family)